MAKAGGQFGAGSDDAARVREIARIEEVIRDVVMLKPAGKEFKCLCPFHDDHNPSMAVVPHKQFFKCFVCGAGGDVFTFVMRYHRMEFREALEFLAQKYGVELKPWKPSGDNRESGATTRKSLIEANQIAAGFFQALLAHNKHGDVARALIAKRGISEEIAKRFLLGTSADRWDGLVQYIADKHFEQELFVEGGLLKRRETGGCYDVFRNRLMFPIQDVVGRVIAFGARRINDEEEPKYLNSPETALFNKSATLYALNHAAKSIQAKRTAIITEGYMDTIACHQAGVENAVAVLGTGLTREHARVLRRFCTTIVLLFDGDEAGRKAADRAFPIFFGEEIDVKVATLARHTDAKDPDELLKRADGRETFDRVIDAAEDIISYRFTRVRERLGGAGIAETAGAVNAEIAELVNLGLGSVEPVRQKLIVKHLAKVAGVQEGVIERAIPAGRSSDRHTTSVARDIGEVRKFTVNEHVLGCLISQGSLWNTLRMEDQAAIAVERFESADTQSIAVIIRDLVDNGEGISLGAVCRASESESVHNTAAGLVMGVECFAKNGDLKDYLNDCLVDFRARASEESASQDPRARFLELRENARQHGINRRKLPRPN